MPPIIVIVALVLMTLSPTFALARLLVIRFVEYSVSDFSVAMASSRVWKPAYQVLSRPNL